jgi:predicted ATP-dependent protease
MSNDRTRRLHALFFPAATSCGHNRWCPAADVYRTADGWLVKVGLAWTEAGGEVPKDGPSAGVAMVTALASAYGDVPARQDTAMTGEITLSGLVLPIGGVKEKVLAARRAGIHRVILPRDNERDLHELPEQVREEMEFILAERIEEALAASVPELAQHFQPVGQA